MDPAASARQRNNPVKENAYRHASARRRFMATEQHPENGASGRSAPYSSLLAGESLVAFSCIQLSNTRRIKQRKP
ncbi:hypothetical protein [Pelagicoccus sp. SDUM812003]|uniref:hypothetical protein n=1 Tax=Pelagicoccus sp. SDUM812003 TaxID=3041267 RepID=UPI00280DFD04|nr:hypothetical protein [Pelagicoccus sp. SDUM812003]MDQ8204717.1 hypothetical protein [Pelagicoccus sp. SDUM812003]